MKSRQKGKKKGSSKERVFGCDLREHLQHSGQEVPQVLRSCAEFVQEYGVVDGIYRLSGVSSNIQKLRQEFEAEKKPDLRRDVYLQDIHCVSSLCKAYFRELPDPLLTYRLYDKFAEAVAVQLEPERLVKILEVLQELPIQNYRTLEFLMRHLVHMASFSAQTNMHARNLAIVWAPNLLRSKDIEASGFNGTAAFMEVRVQSIVVEFILTHVDQLFRGDSLSAGVDLESGWKSLPGARASGSSEELMPTSLPYHLPSVLQAGDGPPQIRPYHTIIEIAEHKRKGSLKVRKWRSIFNLGRSGHETKRKLPLRTEDREEKSSKGTLRPAKSMDSLSAAAGASDEPEGLVGSSSSQPSSLMTENLESSSMDAAEGEQESEAEAQGSANSEPGTPRAGRSAVRALGSSRAERCAGVHISDPYNVNLPLHITSILSVPPNIISNVSLVRLTRGLECPALQPRPSPASGPGPGPGLGPGPPDEKSESRSVPGPLDDLSPEDMAPALEDSLSQEVEEFSVEPPLDDLSLDDAQYVLAPNCCSLDSAVSTPDVEEDYGEEVFLSAYDDLSPLLGPKPINWEGVGSLEEEAATCGKQPLTQAEEEQACSETRQDKEAEPRSTSDNGEEAKATPETEIQAGKADEEGGEAEKSHTVMGSFEEGSREELEAKEENSRGQEVESIEETKDMGKTRGEQGKDEKEREIGRKEGADKGEDTPVEAEMDPEHVLQEYLVPKESWEVVHKHEGEKGREGEIKELRQNNDRKSGEDQGHSEDSTSPEEGDDGKEEGVSKEQKSIDVETEGMRGIGDHFEEGALSEGPDVELLRVESTEEINEQSSEMEQAPLQPSEPEGTEAEGQLNPETCDLYPCPCGSAGGVGMRLASTPVQVRQVRSVPVVPPKPQFAKMPSPMCSKIHIAPASPCPRPGRLDGTPGEKAWGSRASWRNGGSLSFDAAVALARERQRTEAQGVWRTQTCTGDYSFSSRTSPCSMISAHSSRPLSCLELPPEGTEGSEPRSRLSLPPRELHPAVPLVAPQRQTYAFETQTNHGRDEGV
ncbi:rho GTPase-activating protein 30 isoform X3 [Grammomys surdaster]|uniref:rho GTPase-activating protein 30 isoform X3 n=1 Tax=Grammomys surdaster TaxID=491861 RepID=UPI00109F1174|nr:rho GTPase-activating protein 30 isoform X3 [Grammomys surdaster]